MESGGHMTHDRNVIAAAAVLVADRIRAAVEAETGAGGASASAVTALFAWADGAHIDSLAAGLRLSHSRTVRVVDRLEREGLAVRRSDPGDARRALVALTATGRRLAMQALAARALTIDELVGNLSGDALTAVARAAESLLVTQARSRSEARAICRMCDTEACGHRIGDCPSTTGADARGPASNPHARDS